MTNRVAIVKNLLTGEFSLDEIQTKLGLTNREFSDILKAIRDDGYNLATSYSSDGRIITRVNRNLNLNPSKNVRIAVKDKVLRAIFISDLHIGSIYERPELLRRVYRYAKEHNIHIIFNCGDLIDNIYPESDQILSVPTLQGQVRRLIRIHPFEPGIINFNLYGNHDYKAVLDEGFDIARYVETKRYDMVSLGYGSAMIMLKDDVIAIAHDLKRNKGGQNNSDVTITFKGHSHKSKNSFKESKMIYVPSLSEDKTAAYEYRPLPGFLDAEFKFYDKKIERVNIRQLAIVANETRLANEEALILRKVPNRYDGRNGNRPKSS